MKTFQVYTVTNKITQKVYLSYTLNAVKYRNTSYFTSNTALYDDIQKYGIENFVKNVIREFSSKNDTKMFFRDTLVQMRTEGVKLYNDMCSYGYVYLTTNTVNGMKYIGQHRITGDPAVDENYFGSGSVIGRALKKYGKKNFRKEILVECDSADELNRKEIELIEKYDAVNRKDFYNIAVGGSFGDLWTGRSYYKKLKFKKKIAESNRTRSRDSSKICGKNNPSFGKHWYKDMKNRKQYYLLPDDPLIEALGLIRGMFRTKAHNKKIGDANRGKKKTYVVYAKGKVLMNDGHKNIFSRPEDVQTNLQKGLKLGNINYNLRNKVHMNDGVSNYCISKNKVKFYMEEKGFKLGWIRINE